MTDFGIQQARDLLLAAYEVDRFFADEREERQREFIDALRGTTWENLARTLALYLGWPTPVRASELQDGLPKRKMDVGLPFGSYLDSIINTCQSWGLEYNWAPTELAWRDYYAVHRDAEARAQDKVWMDVAANQGKPPLLLVTIPTVLWEGAPKADVMAFVEKQLNAQHPRAPKVRVPYTLMRQARWVFERNARRLTLAEITLSDHLNPDPDGVGQEAIERGIRGFNKLVGGHAPRTGGSHKGRQTRRD